MIRRQVLKSSLIYSFIAFAIGIIIFSLGTTVLVKGIINRHNTLPIEAKVMTIIFEDAEYDEHGNKIDKDLYRAIYIQYKVDGIVYDTKLPYYDETLDIGSKVIVYYKIDNPSEIIGSNRFVLQSSIMIVIGLVLICVKAVFFVRYFKEEKRIKYLLSLNKYFDASIICVEEYEKEIKNNVVPKRIYCMYQNIEYKSNLIWEDANLNALVDHKVKVYYENDDYKNYYVDYTKVE